MTQRKYSLDFRKEEINLVMQRWSAGLSCSLVGVGSVGKSNLLQHLTDLEVQKYHRGAKADLFYPINVDANLLGAFPAEPTDAFRCWAGYELLMHRLYMALYPFDMLPADEAQRFYDLYRLLQDGTNPIYQYMGLRYFEMGMSIFFRNKVKIVFMLDEFEELVARLPVKFFLTLRGVRDMYKRSLLFLTFSREPISVLIDRYTIEPLLIEPFAELFSDGIFYIGPYNAADSQAMVDELATRHGKTFAPVVTQAIQRVTGRYAGLLRAVFAVMDTLPNLNWGGSSVDVLAAALIARHPIRTECATIWKSLTPAEHYVLKAAAQLVPYQKTEEAEFTVSMLVQKRLLQVDTAQQTLSIEPPIFRHYVMTNPAS